MHLYQVTSAKGEIPEIDLIRYSVTKGTFKTDIGLGDPVAKKMTLNMIVKPRYDNLPYTHATVMFEEDITEIDHVLVKFHRKWREPTDYGWPVALTPYNSHTNKRGEVRFQGNPVYADLADEFRDMRDTHVVVKDWEIQSNGDLHVRAKFGRGQIAEPTQRAVLEIKPNQSDAEVLRLVRLAEAQNLHIRIAA